MIEFVQGSQQMEGKVGILPAAFNPPTTAHVALAEVAQDRFQLDQIVFVLPKQLPHKSFDGAGFEQRLDWICRLADQRATWAAASSQAGLVVDIVRAFRATSQARFSVICGKDAAHRFATWDYGDAPSFAEQLLHFELLVGDRLSGYEVPSELSGRVRPFSIPVEHQAVSATDVREKLTRGADWKQLVPESLHSSVERAFSPKPA